MSTNFKKINDVVVKWKKDATNDYEITCTWDFKCPVFQPIENPSIINQKIQFLIDNSEWTCYLMLEVFKYPQPYSSYGGSYYTSPSSASNELSASLFNVYLVDEFKTTRDLVFQEIKLYNSCYADCVNFQIDESSKRGSCFKTFDSDIESPKEFKLFCCLKERKKVVKVQSNNHTTTSSKQNEIDNLNKKCTKILKEFDDYEKLLKSGEYSDITLKFKNNHDIIKAHKNILAARSPVFASILSKPENINEFEVCDYTFGIMNIVLRFIYCGKMENYDFNTTCYVLYAGNKYVLPGLVEKCEEHLTKYVTVGNAIDIAVLSQDYNLNLLKDFIIDYIVKNYEKFTKNDFFKLNSEILTNVLIKNTLRLSDTKN